MCKTIVFLAYHLDSLLIFLYNTAPFMLIYVLLTYPVSEAMSSSGCSVSPFAPKEISGSMNGRSSAPCFPSRPNSRGPQHLRYVSCDAQHLRRMDVAGNLHIHRLRLMWHPELGHFGMHESKNTAGWKERLPCRTWHVWLYRHRPLSGGMP